MILAELRLNIYMKTLRTMLDRLDEISRRDFIKGVGATAGLATIGQPRAQTNPEFTFRVLYCYALRDWLDPVDQRRLDKLLNLAIKDENVGALKVKAETQARRAIDQVTRNAGVGPARDKLLSQIAKDILEKTIKLQAQEDPAGPTADQIQSIRDAMSR